MKPSRYNIIIEDNNNIIVINTLTNAVTRVDNNVKRYLESELTITDGVEAEAIKLLAENGFIVPDQLDEYEKVLEIERQVINGDSDSANFVIAPTMACNFRCKYCFENCVVNKETATHEELVDIITFIENNIKSNKLKKIHISWFGGEPLLQINAISFISDSIIEYCNSNNVEYTASIITNGYLLTEDVAKVLNKCMVGMAQISLDGTEDIYEDIKGTPKGAYRKIINNIQNASEYMNINVRLNIQQDNYDSIYSYIDEISEYFSYNKNITVYLAEMQDYTNDIMYSDKYMNILNNVNKYIRDKGMQTTKNKVGKRRRTHCGLLKKNNFVIGPHAELYKCEHSIGHNEDVIGTCQDGIYYNEAYRKHSSVNRPDKCKECDIFPFCMSKCPNDLLTKKISDASCEAQKEYIIEYYKNKYSK